VLSAIRNASVALDRSNGKRVVALGAIALLANVALAADVGAQSGSACADKVVQDLRSGKVTDVAGLLVEPPSYGAEQAGKDRQASAGALRAILDTTGAMESAAPMAARRSYYRVLISGGEPEAWATVGRPMVTGVAELDVRFARAGRGILILKFAKGAAECTLASIDIGLDAEPAEARERMIDVNVAVMKAVGVTGAPDEMRQGAESILTTYDAGPSAAAAPRAGGADPDPSARSRDGAAAVDVK
jgi:hypothetical protein